MEQDGHHQKDSGKKGDKIQPGADFEALAGYWDLFERRGLNPEKLGSIGVNLGSRVLLLGSGQGLVSSRLGLGGIDVCSVDQSKGMADKAKERFGVHTLIADAATLRLNQSFSSVIVSTGVLSRDNFDSLAPAIIDTIKAHLQPGGLVLIAYFSKTQDSFVERTLRCDRSAEGSKIVMSAEGDSKLAYERLLESGHFDRTAIDALNAEHYEEFVGYVELMNQIRVRALAAQPDKDPSMWFNSIPYVDYTISQDQQKQLFVLLKRNGFNEIEVVEFKDSTSVMTARFDDNPRTI